MRTDDARWIVVHRARAHLVHVCTYWWLRPRAHKISKCHPQAGVDRRTSKRYVTAAVAAGVSREGGEKQLTDELIGQVVSVVRPDGTGWGGRSWRPAASRSRSGPRVALRW
jgi:hypothetical protein